MILAAMLALSCTLPPADSWVRAPSVPLLAAARAYHVRALSSRVREWIDTGTAHSSTFQDLLDRLAASDLIVYVTTVDSITGGSRGHLMFAAATPDARYLRIELVGSGNRIEMVAALAHELQHAVEVADAPWVTDGNGLAALYIRAGHLPGRLDSVAARIIGDKVRDELGGRRFALR